MLAHCSFWSSYWLYSPFQFLREASKLPTFELQWSFWCQDSHCQFSLLAPWVTPSLSWICWNSAYASCYPVLASFCEVAVEMLPCSIAAGYRQWLWLHHQDSLILCPYRTTINCFLSVSSLVVTTDFVVVSTCPKTRLHLPDWSLFYHAQ